MMLNNEQSKAVYSRVPMTVVSAGAGSGKTKVLTERYVHICEEGLRAALIGEDTSFGAGVDEIVAITFTEKASREMRLRIRKLMQEKLAQVEDTYDLDHHDKARIYWRTQLDALSFAPISTFHGFCHTTVTEHPLEAGTYARIQILDDIQASSLLLQVLTEMFQDEKNALRWQEAIALFGNEEGTFRKSLETIYSRLREIPGGLDNIQASCEPTAKKLMASKSARPEQDEDAFRVILHTFEDMLVRLHDIYSERKADRAALDFADLQILAVNVLRNEHVQDAYRRKYRHFLVDEFQDTNPLQMMVLELISPQYLFIVGDAKQSIYGFRGADVRLMNRVVEEAKELERVSLGKEAIFIDMALNYRSCGSVIDTVNTLFEQMMRQDMRAEIPYYMTPYSPLRKHRPSSTEGFNSKIEWIMPAENQDEDLIVDQYELLSRRMMQFVKEEKPCVFDSESKQWRAPQWGDMAVLIPTRSCLLKLQQALDARYVPYVVHGGVGFYDQPEIRDMLQFLDWLNQPMEPLNVLGVLRSPMFGVDLDGLLKLQNSAGSSNEIPRFIYSSEFMASDIDAELKEPVSKLRDLYTKWVPFTGVFTLRTALTRLFDESGLRFCLLLQPNNLQRIRNVEKLVDILCQIEASSLDEVVRKVSRIAKLSANKEGDAEVESPQGNMVRIMTIHAAKGLEFPIVFLPYLNRPISEKGTHIRFHEGSGVVARYPRHTLTAIHKGPTEVQSVAFEEAVKLMKSENMEEQKRLLYVAMTRARDHLVLASDHTTKPSWYCQLVDIYNNSPVLQSCIAKVDSVPDMGIWNDESNAYPGPSVCVERIQPVTLSVSEVMSYMDDPDGYYLKHILQIDPRWLQVITADPVNDSGIIEDDGPVGVNEDLPTKTKVVEATVLGTLVHAACELADAGFPQELAVAGALALISEDEDVSVYEDQVMSFVADYRYASGQIVGSSVENEFPFCLDVAGALVVGRIDKVMHSESGYHVIDLKTNRTDNLEELIAYYKPQLHMYKMAYEQAKDVRVTEMSLMFLRLGAEGLVKIPFDPACQQQIEQAIIRIVDWKRGCNVR